MRQALVTLALLTLALAAPRAEAKRKTVVKDTNTYVIKTSLGDIKIALDADKAPISVKNFKSYADAKFYDGTIFHRVIAGFMIQGGGFDKDMTKKKTNAPIKNEASNGLKNDEGTIAMARTSDPDSATSQFYINVADNAALNYKTGNPGYCVFGKVIEGMDVVHKIERVQTGMKNGMKDVPVDTVLIESVRPAE